jgi:hypothetical protein
MAWDCTPKTTKGQNLAAPALTILRFTVSLEEQMQTKLNFAGCSGSE